MTHSHAVAAQVTICMVWWPRDLCAGLGELDDHFSTGVTVVAVITVPAALTPRSPVRAYEPSVLTLTAVKQNCED